jgi:hypothetical protein
MAASKLGPPEGAITLHELGVTLVILLHGNGYCKLYEARARSLAEKQWFPL